MAIRKIVSRSIGTDIIAAEDLAANSVTVAEIQDGAVTSAKMNGLTGSSSGIIQADGDGTLSTTTADLVDDTTPQLGGNLDLNSNNINEGTLLIDSERIRVPNSSSAISSPNSGDIYFDTSENKLGVYDGTAFQYFAADIITSGGTKTQSGSTITHTFTSTGTFAFNGPVTDITVTVLGGGGGGGAGFQDWASGGGGGGYAQAVYTITGGNHAVVVGQGGAGQTVCDNSLTGGNGGNSSFTDANNGSNVITGNGGQGGGQTSEIGLGGTRSAVGYKSGTTPTLSGGSDGASGGGDGSGGGGNNGGGSGYGTGAAGVSNGTPGNHATGNGNGGGGGHSCQGPHRGGGDGSAGIVIISFTV
jgi:hypothetical protein